MTIVSLEEVFEVAMKKCCYCDYSNYDSSSECRKCQASLIQGTSTRYRARLYLVGPQKAQSIRQKAISGFLLGLLMMVYWGGYGPWPVTDDPNLISLRHFLEPTLLYGGTLAYCMGWVLSWV